MEGTALWRSAIHLQPPPRIRTRLGRARLRGRTVGESEVRGAAEQRGRQAVIVLPPPAQHHGARRARACTQPRRRHRVPAPRARVFLRLVVGTAWRHGRRSHRKRRWVVPVTPVCAEGCGGAAVPPGVVQAQQVPEHLAWAAGVGWW